MSSKINKYLQYGVSSEIAQRAVSKGISKTTFLNTSKTILVDTHNFSIAEVADTKRKLRRKKIEDSVLFSLLEKSNSTCCVCKGTKGSAIVIHHIVPYEETQDNSYENLAVVCLNDHDRSHQTGLSLGLTPQQLLKFKDNWEVEVCRNNSEAAARLVQRVSESGIDYFNINKLEELCLASFGTIPETSVSTKLQKIGILDEHRSLNESWISENLSKNGSYLFDFTSKGEVIHYKALMNSIFQSVSFTDINVHQAEGYDINDLTGTYGFYTGAVTSKSVKLPISISTPQLKMRSLTRKIVFEWSLTPKYIMSGSAFSRLGGTNTYQIFCLIGAPTNLNDNDENVVIKCSPLMVCLPGMVN